MDEWEPPVEICVESAWFQRLKTKYDKLLSSLAFNFNLRHYSAEIETLQKMLVERPPFNREPQRSWVMPLHGSLPHEEQAIVFTRPPHGAGPYNRSLFPFQLNSSPFETHFKWGQGPNGST